MKFKILIIDDEKNIRDIFSLVLEEKGYIVETASQGNEGIERAKKFSPDLILLDMNLPDMTGMDVLSRSKGLLPKSQIIIITAFGTIKSAIEATKLGAYDYLEKPVDNEELLLIISRALEVKKLAAEVENLKTELSSQYRFSNIIGMSSQMKSVFQLMAKIARVGGTVLITGESGTGKELVARAIHFNSPRKNNPFVVVSCGAIPKDLIESEFFGHTKGAFTDARTEKTGKFELAHYGTIFLDEIGELSQDAQVKLLRALGEKEIVKVGGTTTIPIDIRVIAATNKNLDNEVKRGFFREDLYYRLVVLSIHIPPLRERKDDIPLLCEHFIKKYSRELKKEITGITRKALEFMMAYPWPGNVRELENIIYESIVLCENKEIDEKNLPSRIKANYINFEKELGFDLENLINAPHVSLKNTIQNVAENIEKSLIEKVLKEMEGNKTLTANRLGISRKTLFNKIKALKIHE